MFNRERFHGEATCHYRFQYSIIARRPFVFKFYSGCARVRECAGAPVRECNGQDGHDGQDDASLKPKA